MKTRRVVLSPRAEADLEDIVLWIADKGAPLAALDYVRRIRLFIESLDQFAERATPHDEVRKGLRILPFADSVVIALALTGDQVRVLRVFSSGQDWKRSLRNRRRRDRSGV